MCASNAEEVGVSVKEKKKARYLKTRKKKKKYVDKLLEGVIVLEKM